MGHWELALLQKTKNKGMKGQEQNRPIFAIPGRVSGQNKDWKAKGKKSQSRGGGVSRGFNVLKSVPLIPDKAASKEWQS